MHKHSALSLLLAAFLLSPLLVDFGFAKGSGGTGDSPVGNGDVNGDGEIDFRDLVHLARFLWGGPEPVPIELPAGKPTVIHLVRHAEDDRSTPDRSLTALGRERAALLAEHFREAAVTHVLSSHKTRALQTVQPTAEEHGIEVDQFPQPGSILDGAEVTEDTSTSASIGPMLEALGAVPCGSVVLVAGHSSTLFAIIAGLGVRVGSEEEPCAEGDTSCLPCTARACFPSDEFDNLWVVAVGQNAAAEAAMVRLGYGDPCPVAGF